MSLIKNVLKPLAKSVLIPLGLTAAAAAATGEAIQKKIFGSGLLPSDLANQTTLIISKEPMNDIMKIIKSLEDAGLLIKGVSKTIENETKERKDRLLNMLLGVLDTSLLGNLLTGKGVKQSKIPGRKTNIPWQGVMWGGEETTGTDHNF